MPPNEDNLSGEKKNTAGDTCPSPDSPSFAAR